ncbi:helix-turn-helix domain-containing protein [Pseudenhygromyxa sp. WMMC2535]|uniref:helix-turn-helix domain-containing protein n=1 Tax=Pseudenhygromyxa sp. WMMC2535 TaxID=2712867 RepID=UPI00155504A3|nr:helix-turn-helix domain-containing protein [Pseudenhygromyxa sp. WMMC2535]
MPSRPTTDPSALPHLLHADDVANLLRLTRKAVYCMVHRGEFSGVVRIGQRVRFKRDDLLRWLETQ